MQQIFFSSVLDRGCLRAKAVWSQGLTCKILAKLIGCKGPGVLGNPLAFIAYWYNDNKLSPLTSFVVNENTGLQAKGIPIKKAPTYQGSVYAFDRFKIVPQTREDLRLAYESA